jgi:hypothetical protein
MSSGSYTDKVEDVALNELRSLAATNRGKAARLYVAIEQFTKVVHLSRTAGLAEILATRGQRAVYLVPPSVRFGETDAAGAMVLVDHRARSLRVLKIIIPGSASSLTALLAETQKLLIDLDKLKI